MVVFILLLVLGSSSAQAATKDKASAPSCSALKQRTITKPATPQLAKLAKTASGRQYLRLRKRVVCKFSLQQPGAHILYMGAGQHHRPPSREKLRQSIARFERWLAPTPTSGSGSALADGSLEAIAQCESGGNPATDTGNGFYGKYQFSLPTWQSVGGSGNPAAASEAEQNQRAAMLYAREGASPWPVCGR